MKKLIVPFLILASVFFIRCNNSDDKGRRVDDDSYLIVNPHGDTTFYYVIHQSSTRWFYASSNVELTSATQVGPSDWSFSATMPSFLSDPNIEYQTTESISEDDLPSNLVYALNH